MGTSEILMSTGCSSTYTAAFVMVFSLCAHSLTQLLCHQKPAVFLSHWNIIVAAEASFCWAGNRSALVSCCSTSLQLADINLVSKA